MADRYTFFGQFVNHDITLDRLRVALPAQCTRF